MDRKPACREAFRWLKELGYQHLALIFTRKDKRNSTYQLGQKSFKQVLSEEKRTIVLKSEFIER